MTPRTLTACYCLELRAATGLTGPPRPIDSGLWSDDLSTCRGTEHVVTRLRQGELQIPTARQGGSTASDDAVATHLTNMYLAYLRRQPITGTPGVKLPRELRLHIPNVLQFATNQLSTIL
jgi:hypothetical protein